MPKKIRGFGQAISELVVKGISLDLHIIKVQKTQVDNHFFLSCKHFINSKVLSL